MATAIADFEVAEAEAGSPVPTSPAAQNVVQAMRAAASPSEYTIPRSLMARLEVMANKRGWSISEALARSLNVAEVVLDANDDPTTKIYIHQQGARYKLNIPR